MKKLFACFLVLSLFSVAFCQNDQYLDDRRYIKIGASLAGKNYFGRGDFGLNYDNNFGFSIDNGRLFILNSIIKNEKLALGIDFTYIGLQFNYFENGSMPYSASKTKEGSIYLFSRVGPSFSYSPAHGLVFDFYFKANLSWIGIAYIGDEFFSANDTYMWGGFLGVGYTPGINIRYKFIMLGLEYSTVHMRMESADYEGEYLRDWSNPEKGTTPLPAVNVSFGFNF